MTPTPAVPPPVPYDRAAVPDPRHDPSAGLPAPTVSVAMAVPRAAGAADPAPAEGPAPPVPARDGVEAPAPPGGGRGPAAAGGDPPGPAARADVAAVDGGRPPAAARGDVETAVRATLLRQAGVITRAQAVAAGLSPDAVDRRLSTRRWHPVHPRVYRDASFAATQASRVRAVVLWAGDGAVLSGSAAAWWLGLLPDPPASVGVTVPRRRCPRARPGISVRRRELAAADVRTVGGIAVVAAPLAALEAAVELGARGPAFLEEQLSSGAVGPAAVRRAHARNAAAHGSASAGRVLAIAAHGMRLRARRRLAVLVGVGGSSGWIRERQVAGLPLELAHPASRTAVSVLFSSLCADDERRWREAVLRRHGWTVVEIDPCDVLARPDEVADRLRVATGPAPAGPAGAAAAAAS